MAFDIDGFLKDLGATEDEAKTLRAALGTPERLSLLEKNQLRQSDYSKEMNTLKGEQKKLTDAQTRLDAEAAEWASLSASEKEQATKLRDSLEKSEAKVLALSQRVTRIATDAGLDVAKALEGIDQPPPKKEDPKVDPIDTSKFVGTEQFQSFGKFMFDLATAIPDIQQEHFELTGERLSASAIRAEIEAKAGEKGANLDPRALWEKKYDIPAKREAKAKKVHDDEITAAEKRGWERGRSEEALPVASSRGQSPLLHPASEHKSVLQRPAPESAVQAARAAFATGKYRQPEPAGAGAK